MAQYPALPLFTDAYLADTRHLSTIQHGAYLLMLMTAWRMPDCALPDDDTFLARICGMDKRTWASNKTILLSFWTRDAMQRWVQGRLLDERIYVEEKRSKNVEAGRASALKKNNRHSTDVITTDQHGHQRTLQRNVNITSTPTPTPTPIKKDTPLSPKGKNNASAFVLPGWVPKTEWDAWMEIRRAKRAKNTDHALGLAVASLKKLIDAGNDAKEVLNQSIMRSYTGLFEIKDQGKGNQERSSFTMGIG